MALRDDSGGEAAVLEGGSGAEKSIEFGVGGVAVIDVGNGFDAKRLRLQLRAVVRLDELIGFKNLMRGKCRHRDEPSIGESLVGNNHVLFRDMVGWKAGHGGLPQANQQGAVAESMLVVVHEAAVEQEGAVAGLAHDRIPLVGQMRLIGLNGEHFL